MAQLCANLPHLTEEKYRGRPVMGRGRSKAKQTKVARDLKYSNQDMDLERLVKELHGEAKEDKGFDDDSSNDNYTPRN
jgi:hypothetical protein